MLNGPQRTRTELEKLASILREAREKKLSADDIISEVNNKLPELSLKDILPNNRSELYSFLGLIISIIMLFLTLFNNNTQKTEITINQVVNYVFEQQNKNTMSQQGNNKVKIDTNRNEPNKVIKIGRNEKCPCGSGKKYKFCCGK